MGLDYRSYDPVALDQIWKRNAGRERVRVERIWDWPEEGVTVRARPVRGGRVLIADLGWLTENYALEGDD
jgi:hypothetical protein